MKYSDNKVKDVQVTYIGGGSRGWAWTFMTDLTLEDQISGTIRLHDIDGGAAKSNEMTGSRLMQGDDARGDWKFETSASLKNTLTGCDFVVISILPDTFDRIESDTHLPKRLEICQSVGDTAGPGGMVRVLHAIPMFAEIVGVIEEYAPKARVINYANPMSLCIKALYHVFPEIKALGCYHEVSGTRKVLKRICEESSGKTDIDWHDIHVNVLDISHFTRFSGASYKEIDSFPIYREYIDRHFDRGYEMEDEGWMNSSFKYASRVKVGLFKRYGLIAAAGDRHLAEFVPGNEYLNDPETVASWRFGLTTMQQRRNDLKEGLERGRRLAPGEGEVKLEPIGEKGILLIRALYSLTRVISNMNILNTACQITNLPAGALVETNAVFEKDHIYPVVMGITLENVRELLMLHLENHELVMEAALNPDREEVVRAFTSDPLVKGENCREEDVRLLMGGMTKDTLRYLPRGWEQTKMRHDDELLKLTDVFIISLAPIPRKEPFYDAAGGPSTHSKTWNG